MPAPIASEWSDDAGGAGLGDAVGVEVVAAVEGVVGKIIGEMEDWLAVVVLVPVEVVEAVDASVDTESGCDEGVAVGMLILLFNLSTF